MNLKLANGIRAGIASSALTLLASTAAAEDVVIALQDNPLHGPTGPRTRLRLGGEISPAST